eukprot:9535799-Alexandrium_andersonii.AAC.1
MGERVRLRARTSSGMFTHILRKSMAEVRCSTCASRALVFGWSRPARLFDDLACSTSRGGTRAE